MDQLICASLSHTHYWYEVGMFKVPCSSEMHTYGRNDNYQTTYIDVAVVRAGEFTIRVRKGGTTF